VSAQRDDALGSSSPSDGWSPEGFDDPPAVLFDLDGTLIDSVYQHVVAWHAALLELGIDLPIWRIHRRIGMSGGLFVAALARETSLEIDGVVASTLSRLHSAALDRLRDSIRPLPGAQELLSTLSAMGVAWAIATSGLRRGAEPALDLLGVPGAVLVTRDEVRHAKPDPDLFLAAAARLGVAAGRCLVVGDSVWDLLAARRAGSLGIGLLSGGYGADELERAGAYRVYEDPAGLLRHLDEVGVRDPRG
jgi:HAD superfamily hydrolase (TIGR01509 family)